MAVRGCPPPRQRRPTAERRRPRLLAAAGAAAATAVVAAALGAAPTPAAGELPVVTYMLSNFQLMGLAQGSSSAIRALDDALYFWGDQIPVNSEQSTGQYTWLSVDSHTGYACGIERVTLQIMCWGVDKQVRGVPFSSFGRWRRSMVGGVAWLVGGWVSFDPWPLTTPSVVCTWCPCPAWLFGVGAALSNHHQRGTSFACFLCDWLVYCCCLVVFFFYSLSGHPGGQRHPDRTGCLTNQHRLAARLCLDV